MGLNGTQHMLKALGIDPAEIMAGIEGFKKLAVEVKERQERVEAKLDLILSRLDEIQLATKTSFNLDPALEAAYDKLLLDNPIPDVVIHG